jgi:hypothetical protein
MLYANEIILASEPTTVGLDRYMMAVGNEAPMHGYTGYLERYDQL